MPKMPPAIQPIAEQPDPSLLAHLIQASSALLHRGSNRLPLPGDEKLCQI